jgi:glycosyltransferase involved in cell wall biosynthesis
VAGLADGRDRPSVVIVAHGIHETGGMERALAELIRRIHREWRVVVVAAEVAADLRPLVDWRRVRVPRRPIPLKFLAFFALGSLRLARVRTDLVHATGAIVANRADVATVHLCHAGFREATGALAPKSAPPIRRANTTVARVLALAAERWCYRPGRLRLLAAVSRGVATELARHYPAVPVRVTPNGVDVECFASDDGARDRLRREEGVAPGVLVALFVGGDWDRKGLHLAIEGVAAARDRGAQVELWVVGRGQEPRFGQLAKRAGVAERVRFFGARARADVARFYQAADVFVLPTAYETFSLVAHEAAACGLPVVGTRVSGIEDLVGADDAGILVARTAQAVGDALARLAADTALRQAMGAEGRRRTADLTWDQSVATVVDLYGSLSRPSRPDRRRTEERVG